MSKEEPLVKVKWRDDQHAFEVRFANILFYVRNRKDVLDEEAENEMFQDNVYDICKIMAGEIGEKCNNLTKGNRYRHP